MSLSQNQIKLITSLQQKKYRTKHNSFIAEGRKAVGEFLGSIIELKTLYCVDPEDYSSIENKVVVSPKELQRISNLKTPNNVVAIFAIPDSAADVNCDLTLVLDGINDPGNLGTIIRLCDWFDIKQIICSNDSVDCYNPKVVQSSMGSLARIKIIYTDLVDFLSGTTAPIVTTDMMGENLFNSSNSISKGSILVMGSEANGIQSEVKALATSTLKIPKFGDANQTESLNVATATAIFLCEFRRVNQ